MVKGGYTMESHELAQLIEEASEKINMAHSLLIIFGEKYLDTEESHKDLQFDLNCRFNILNELVNSIFDAVCQAKTTLDIYSDPQSAWVGSFISHAMHKKTLSDAVKKEREKISRSDEK